MNAGSLLLLPACGEKVGMRRPLPLGIQRSSAALPNPRRRLRSLDLSRHMGRGAITSSHRHDEQAREAQQHLAVVTRLVGGDDLRGIGGEKFFAVAGIERRQERLQRRALEPFGDRLPATP